MPHDLQCERCGTEYKNLPDSIKPPIYCGHCKSNKQRDPLPIEIKVRIEPELVYCIHRGDNIGYLDCKCRGNRNVYQCELLKKNCMDVTPNKPWSKLNPFPKEGYEINELPLSCASCTKREE